MTNEKVNGFKIEDGVPVPKARLTTGELAPTLEALQVGQSFLIPATPETINGVRSRVSYTTTTRGMALGRKFALRTVEGGVRIWRTE